MGIQEIKVGMLEMRGIRVGMLDAENQVEMRGIGVGMRGIGNGNLRRRVEMINK